MNAFAPVAEALMAERRTREVGMLFSAPMVRALLDGRKTQTRRLAVNRTANKIRVGNRIWVRETWHPSGPNGVRFRANMDTLDALDGLPWRPAIHMPRAAARILLEVTDVRFQKLHAITEADAIAEGVESMGNGSLFGVRGEAGALLSALGPIEAYGQLWDSINGAGSWDANPDVVALTFTRLPDAHRPAA